MKNHKRLGKTTGGKAENLFTVCVCYLAKVDLHQQKCLSPHDHPLISSSKEAELRPSQNDVKKTHILKLG